MHTLSYVNNPQAVLREVARVLEPGGKFIFLVRRRPSSLLRICGACFGGRRRPPCAVCWFRTAPSPAPAPCAFLIAGGAPPASFSSLLTTPMAGAFPLGPRPGAALASQENVAERGIVARLFQRLGGPWWSSLLGYRFQDTESLIRRAFEADPRTRGHFKVDLERFRAKGQPFWRRYLAPHVRGVVTKLSQT